MVQALYAQKQQEGKSSRAIAIIHSVLNSALENAISWDLVTRNVAKLARHPTVEHYEAQTLTLEKALKLLEVARGSQMDAMLLFAVTTGMRRGEILSLRWDDIDFERSVIFVHRTVNRIIGRGFVEGEPETKAGRCRLLLLDVAIEAFATTADIYSHVLPEMQQELVDKKDGLFKQP